MDDNNIYGHIRKLLADKSLTNYRIGKEAGVDNSIVLRLRNGNRRIKNLRLGTAEKLNACYLRLRNGDDKR